MKEKLNNINIPSFARNLSIAFNCSEKAVASQLNEMTINSLNTINSFADSIAELIEAECALPALPVVIEDLGDMANKGITASEAGKLYAMHLKYMALRDLHKHASQIEDGFYWLYFIHDKEWSVGEFNGNEWVFLGNDETFRELPDNVCIGVRIQKPPYHITTELAVKSDI